MALLEILSLELLHMSLGSFISGGILAAFYRHTELTNYGKKNLILFLTLSIPIVGLFSKVELYIIFMYLLGIMLIYTGLLYISSDTSLKEEFETEAPTLTKEYKWK